MTKTNAPIPDPTPTELLIDGLRYRTSASTRIAYHWRPGHATRYYSTARRIHLFATPRGHYFCQEQETEPDSIETGPFGFVHLRTVDRNEALRIYLESDTQLVPLAEAFPGVEIEA